ncbi:hypothetical protein BLA60_26455 [Actinophytocola xinjiangensis]|uniref:Uncharacterized protein n=2 Tax=Actinophytocola xinjiangensis TaxID=485602 RepID=A0A7Z0WJB1_9PSEU|nr:hypothetical protein BLA60_26455 [Actinophytocola xinjiangensis]
MAPVAAVPPVAEPAAVRVAFWLTLGGAALFLALVGLWIGVGWGGLRDSARTQLMDNGDPVGSGDVDVRARAATFVIILFAVVGTAPYVTFAALLVRGRNWARVLLTVLVSIGGFVALVAVFLPYDHDLGPATRLVALALAGVSAAIVSLLFGRRVNRYFA